MPAVTRVICCLFVVSCLCGRALPAEKNAEGTALFPMAVVNGCPVTWISISEVPGTALDDVWQIDDDGTVVCKGNPKGYIRTEQDFQDFVLTLEWQRPLGKAPGRGGVLIRTTGKDKIWPKSLEAQLNAGGAGDFWGLDGYRLSGPNERLKSLTHETFGVLTNLKKTQDSEKPVGEWNEYRIVADGATVTLFINGRQVNQATGCDVVSGTICLTAEGDAIHFRNVRLKLLKRSEP